MYRCAELEAINRVLINVSLCGARSNKSCSNQPRSVGALPLGSSRTPRTEFPPRTESSTSHGRREGQRATPRRLAARLGLVLGALLGQVPDLGHRRHDRGPASRGAAGGMEKTWKREREGGRKINGSWRTESSNSDERLLRLLSC